MVKITKKIILFVIMLMVFVMFLHMSINDDFDKPYYDVNEIEPKLDEIKKYKNDILKEVISLNENQEKWIDWPEKLYDKKQQWKIFPINVFGKWANNNCKKCPVLTKFLKSIPNLKLAILSKMSEGTVLTPHQGWSKHSNYSLRCHYGLIVPPKSCVKVLDKNGEWKIKKHKKFEWIIFDDSKKHTAENLSNTERIILLVDIKRPDFVPIGNSKIEDTQELIDILKKFKTDNNIID